MKKALRITAVTLSACLLAATSMFGASAKEVTFHKTAFVKGSIAGVKDADIYVVDKTDFDEADPAEKAAEQNKLSAAFDEGKMITFMGDADVLNQKEMTDIIGAKGAPEVKASDAQGAKMAKDLSGVSFQKAAKGISIHQVFVGEKATSDRQVNNAVVKSVSKNYATQPSSMTGWKGTYEGALYNYYNYTQSCTCSNCVDFTRTIDVTREDHAGYYFWIVKQNLSYIPKAGYKTCTVTEGVSTSDDCTLVQTSPANYTSSAATVTTMLYYGYTLMSATFDGNGSNGYNTSSSTSKVATWNFDIPQTSYASQTKFQPVVAALYRTTAQRMSLNFHNYIDMVSSSGSTYTGAGRVQMYFGYADPYPTDPTPTNPKA